MSRTLTVESSGGVTVATQSYNPSGVFGTGQVAFIMASGSFSIPATSIRVRCFGGGGGGSYEYTLGSNGGTTSFGAYLSATGGAKGVGRSGSGASAGGAGSGGDINNTGGDGGAGGSSYQSTGGGGVASYFGNGGAGSNDATANQPGGNSTGGAGGGGCITTSGGMSTGGNGFSSTGVLLRKSYSTTPGFETAAQQIGAFSLDLFGTGGGGVDSITGINGGGGGGGSSPPPNGSFPGGGAGGYYGGGAGGGFSMKEISGLTIGANVTVTIGTGGAGGVNGSYKGGDGAQGLVIVEW